LTVLDINPQTEFAIVEMGASAVGEIATLCEIAKPTIGLITNIGKAHTETFGGLEGVIRGKSELFDFIRKNDGQVFINFTDPVLLNMSKRFKAPQIYPEADMSFVQADPYISYQLGEVHYQTELIGSYNYINMAAALSVGRYAGVEEKLIHKAITEYVPDNNRSEISNVGTNLLVKDAYNANPDSMRAALNNFRAMHGKKMAILGDMNELEGSEKEHRLFGEWVSELGIDRVIFCGHLMRDAHKAYQGSLHFENVTDLSAYLDDQNFEHTKILLKGSRSIELEKLYEILERV